MRWQPGGNLGCAAAARQPDLGLVVRPDHRAVQVAEAVDLRAAEESDRDAAALQPVLKHLRHRHRRQRRLAELAIADRQRKHRGLCFERARLVDERQTRRVRQPREVAGGRGQPDADKADVVVPQGARRRDGHHLRGRVRVRCSCGASARPAHTRGP